MPEWLRAIGQAAPAITSMETATQDMDAKALAMRDVQANLDLKDKPIPLEVHMADRFTNQPEQAKEALSLYTKHGIVKENDAGSKYLTQRGLDYVKSIAMTDAETKAAIRKSQDLDATNEFQAKYLNYQKALKSGDPEKIQAAKQEYVDGQAQFSHYMWATTEHERLINQAKKTPIRETYQNFQDASGNIVRVPTSASQVPSGVTPWAKPPIEKPEKPEYTTAKALERLTHLAVLESNLDKTSVMDAMLADYFGRPDLVGKPMDQTTKQQVKEQIRREKEYVQSYVVGPSSGNKQTQDPSSVLSGKQPGRYRVGSQIIKWDGQKVVQ